MLSSDLKRLALRLLKALDIPDADVISDHIKHQRWDQLANTKFDPLAHQHKSVDEFRKVCLAQEFLRKAEFLDTTFDKDQVARDGFLACEAQCKVANRHLEPFLNGPLLIRTDLERAFYEKIQRARSWIRNTLGKLPTSLNGRFGPGSTFESRDWRHRNITAYDKLRNMPCVYQHTSPDIVDHLVWNTAFGQAWSIACPSRLFTPVRGNRFTTVNKDATKMRGIAMESGINLLGQLAVGDHLKQRLKRRGIDLRGNEDRYHPVLSRLNLEMGRPWKGQELHKRFAQLASVSGSHATIDLSNASDTICLTLVKLLLPEDWYNLLFELRAPYTLFANKKGGEEKWHRLEKFSSMGNGFTFELETLIFASLAYACDADIGQDSFVYGDDIIVPEAVAADLLAVLRYAGLTPNKTKTFYGSDCNFRESCGGDYFKGHDVRPFYIKESPDAPTNWITIANNLWNWSIKWSMPELMAVRASALDNIPTDIARCRGPQILGDLVIHDDECNWSSSRRSSVRYIRVWRPVQRTNYLYSLSERIEPSIWFPLKMRVRTFVESEVALTAALLGLPSDGIHPRNAVEGYRFGRVAYS